MSESRKSKLGRLKGLRKKIKRGSDGTLARDFHPLQKLHHKLLVEAFPTVGKFDDELNRLEKTGFYVP